MVFHIGEMELYPTVGCGPPSAWRSRWEIRRSCSSSEASVHRPIPHVVEPSQDGIVDMALKICASQVSMHDIK